MVVGSIVPAPVRVVDIDTRPVQAVYGHWRGGVLALRVVLREPEPAPRTEQ